jgi:hypothetical protein
MLSEDEIAFICEGIIEAFNEVEGFWCDRQWHTFGYSSGGTPQPKSRTSKKSLPIILEARCTLIREDGHKKDCVVCVIDFDNSKFFTLNDPEGMHASEEWIMRMVHRHPSLYKGIRPDWTGQVKISLANPDWVGELKAHLPLFRSKAAARQGKGGKRSRKRNRMNWS